MTIKEMHFLTVYANQLGLVLQFQIIGNEWHLCVNGTSFQYSRDISRIILTINQCYEKLKAELIEKEKQREQTQAIGMILSDQVGGTMTRNYSQENGYSDRIYLLASTIYNKKADELTEHELDSAHNAYCEFFEPRIKNLVTEILVLRKFKNKYKQLIKTLDDNLEKSARGIEVTFYSSTNGANHD